VGTTNADLQLRQLTVVAKADLYVQRSHMHAFKPRKLQPQYSHSQVLLNPIAADVC
jgi:hypothetical protein